MRTASVFDGTDANGRPILNRPALHPQEIPWIIYYLEQAPKVLVGRGFDPDVYDPRAQDIPQAYSTDGTWIWAGDVVYYLRKYGISPEQALVDHIRAQRFQPPAVSEADLHTAEEDVKRQLGVAPAAAPPPAPPAPAPPSAAVDPARAAAAERLALDTVRGAADELHIDPARIALGARVDGALSFARSGDRWAVVSAVGTAHEFDDPADAAMYFVGHLYLHREEMAREGAPATSPAPPPQPAPAPEQEQVSAPAQEPSQWPFQPLAGEPPLSLFRERSVTELAPGTEVDRVGDPNGNVTYAAGTTWAQRSLPPDWQGRAYHAYRVERPLQAIRGTTIPWFDQPGGGTGYVLPQAIADLLADGSLVEVPGAPPS